MQVVLALYALSRFRHRGRFLFPLLPQIDVRGLKLSRQIGRIWFDVLYNDQHSHALVEEETGACSGHHYRRWFTGSDYTADRSPRTHNQTRVRPNLALHLRFFQSNVGADSLGRFERWDLSSYSSWS
jgi:transposase